MVALDDTETQSRRQILFVKPYKFQAVLNFFLFQVPSTRKLKSCEKQNILQKI